jgi:hypothetical protein
VFLAAISQVARSSRLRVEEAGDCRTPRSIEEAILEGTIAGVALARPVETAAVYIAGHPRRDE